MKKLVIAVFAKCQRDIAEVRVSDNIKLIRIKSFRDFDGYKFDGVMEFRGWWKDKWAAYAYEMLKHRQPELFK